MAYCQEGQGIALVLLKSIFCETGTTFILRPEVSTKRIEASTNLLNYSVSIVTKYFTWMSEDVSSKVLIL